MDICYIITLTYPVAVGPPTGTVRFICSYTATAGSPCSPAVKQVCPPTGALRIVLSSDTNLLKIGVNQRSRKLLLYHPLNLYKHTSPSGMYGSYKFRWGMLSLTAIYNMESVYLSDKISMASSLLEEKVNCFRISFGLKSTIRGARTFNASNLSLSKENKARSFAHCLLSK